MPNVTFVDHDGSVTYTAGRAGDTVMETAVRNGVAGIVAECGGAMACATCHVFVDPDDFAGLGPIGDTEDDMLGATAVERSEFSRLSCQVVLTDDTELHVTTPKTQV